MRIDVLAIAAAAVLLSGAVSEAATPASQRTIQPTAKARPTEREVSRVRRALARIAAREDHCADNFARPVDNVSCRERALEAADAILGPSPNTVRFEALLRDLFDPLFDALAKGSGGSVMQVEVAAQQAELARMRVATLSGVTGLKFGDKLHRRRGLFDWVRDKKEAQALERRWKAVRDADCAAYPVSRCAERLDAGFNAIVHEDL